MAVKYKKRNQYNRKKVLGKALTKIARKIDVFYTDIDEILTGSSAGRAGEKRPDTLIKFRDEFYYQRFSVKQLENFKKYGKKEIDKIKVAVGENWESCTNKLNVAFEVHFEEWTNAILYGNTDKARQRALYATYDAENVYRGRSGSYGRKFVKQNRKELVTQLKMNKEQLRLNFIEKNRGKICT